MFTSYTDIRGGERYSTLSSIIPCYMDLEFHLQEMKKKEAMAPVSELLLTELYKHFSYLIDLHNPNHVQIYPMATALDPRCRILLTDEQAQAEILKCINIMAMIQKRTLNLGRICEPTHQYLDRKSSGNVIC